MTTSKKTNPKVNLFDEEVTSVYQIEARPPRRNLFEIDMEVNTQDQEHMIETFHTQAVAVTGRSTMAQFATTHLTEIADHAAGKMTETVAHINNYVEAAQLGRYQERHHAYNAQLIDSTWRHINQVNEIAARSMFEDMRRPIYRPHQPEHPKRKGLLRGVKELLMGE